MSPYSLAILRILIASLHAPCLVGTFGAAVDVANLGPDELRAELRELRELCNGRPYGVDLLVHGAEVNRLHAKCLNWLAQSDPFVAGRRDGPTCRYIC